MEQMDFSEDMEGGESPDLLIYSQGSETRNNAATGTSGIHGMISRDQIHYKEDGWKMSLIGPQLFTIIVQWGTLGASMSSE